MTRYSRVAPCDGALDHLDVPADAVLLVHDVVAGAQLQRVDDVAAPARHPAHVLGRRTGWPARSVSVSRASPQVLGDEAVLDRRRGHVHDGRLAARRRPTASSRAATSALARARSTQALGRAVALGDDARPASRRASQPAQVGERPLGVAAVADAPRRAPTVTTVGVASSSASVRRTA